MKCEQVEELLSAYLDGALALGEAASSAVLLEEEMADHLQECERCSAALADYCRHDLLLAQLPRVSPDASLRIRLFSSPEYLELTGTDGPSIEPQPVPYRTVRYTKPGRPPLVALPGGRSSSSSAPTTPRLSASRASQQLTRPIPIRRQRASWGLRVMQVAVAAIVLLTLGVGGWIGWNMLQGHTTNSQASNVIIPPAGLPERAPLSEGMHYVFLRDGALWAESAGDAAARQLTPNDVNVAANWVVSPPLPGRYAGDMLAYIDLQQDRVHTIRSDGLNDTVIPQPLLKPGVAWDTPAGMTILASLAWSKDGSTLAFVADPQGIGSTGLYLYSTQTNSVQKVPLPIQGSVSRPTWSPDGTRIAFDLTHHGAQSIVDYNVQDRRLLLIDSHAPSAAYPADTVLSLNWSPAAAVPAITWSVGVIGHVHSIWQQHVGAGWTPAPQAMLTGDYVQAVYSPNGHGVGSWLLVTSLAGRAADLVRLDMTAGALPVQLTRGRQVSIAQWSPDGNAVDYLDSLSNGAGTLHIVNVATASDTLIAAGVDGDPAPAWSIDGQQLVYSAGTRTVVVSLAANAHTVYIVPLRGRVTAFAWSASDPRQLVLALSNGQQRVYIIDTRHHTLHQMDQQGLSGPILWTQVP